MIGTVLGETAPFGPGGSTQDNPVGGTAGAYGVGLKVTSSPWSRENMLMAASRTDVAGSYRADAAAQGITLAPVAAPSFDAPSFEEAPAGIPRALVIGGAAVVGLAVVGAIVFKMRRR